jgi:tetratricopeptide (TPR) repeat protein
MRNSAYACFTLSFTHLPLEASMKKIAVVFLLLFPCLLVARSLEVTQADKDIMKHLFSGAWQKSDSLITNEMAKLPNHPKYYFLKAYHSLYCRMMATNSITRDQSIELIKEYTWKAITIGEQLPQTTDVKFYMGYAYHFLCRANVMRQEWWTAYWNARKCRRLLEEVIEEDASIQDAYFALAITEYYPAVAVTGFKKTLAWIGGMSGNKEKGLQYFHRAAENGNLFQDEAQYVLAIVHGARAAENKPEQALGYWEDLHKRFPQSTTFRNSYNFAYLNVEVRKRGVKFLEDEIDSIKKQYRIDYPYMLNSIGNGLIADQRYNDALLVLNVNSKLYPDYAQTYITLGECYLQQKDNPNAVKYYTMANEKLPADTTVSAQYKETLKTQIAEKLADLGVTL